MASDPEGAGVGLAVGIGLVLDCTNPARFASFWSAALGYTTLGGAGNYVMLVADDGGLAKLLLQAVPEPKSAFGST